MRGERLDRETEVRLAIMIEAGVLARQALDGADQAELRVLVEHGRTAQRRLIEANLGLVGAEVAAALGSSRADGDDLFQAGCVGLIDAVHRFDHTRGLRFSTYAVHRIRAAVNLAAHDPGRLVLTAHGQRERRRALLAAERLRNSLRREPTVAEIAAALGVGARTVSRWLAAGDEIDEVLADAILDEPVRQTGSDGRLGVLLSRLPPDEAAVLSRRFGFGAGEPQQRPAIAAELGWTVGRVRQRERTGLARLRALVSTDHRDLLD